MDWVVLAILLVFFIGFMGAVTAGLLKVQWAVLFLVGMFCVSFTGGVLYRLWYANFYRKPNLFRTQVSLEIDESVVYLNHISSITEEYVHSRFLMCSGFLLGFIVYLLLFTSTGISTSGTLQNMVASVTLTASGGILGILFSLSEQLIIRDSSGMSHILRLKDFERIELKQELTKDIWKLRR
ncbi:MAG: hypothetical protein V1875_05620 [Candidatus Altiarchaeota archaeon]